jgi:hypothetical protein
LLGEGEILRKRRGDEKRKKKKARQSTHRMKNERAIKLPLNVIVATANIHRARPGKPVTDAFPQRRSAGLVILSALPRNGISATYNHAHPRYRR